MSFTVWDGVLFAIMLLASAVIGFYFGVYKKQNTTIDYVFGGKKLSAFPVAASLIVSYTSGTTFLGVPSDVYQYGSLYAVSSLSLFVALLIVHYTFLPVFYKLQLTSTYEYLKLRFGSSIRYIGSLMYTISMLLVMPIIIYAPALAFNQVTGLSITIIIPVVSSICIFYTMTGGLRAVVWTDLLQGIVMFGSLIILIAIGVNDIGGLGTVFQRANEGGRIKIFEMNPDPTIRDTFWTVFIGNIVLIARMLGVLQSSVQRFISTPTLRAARTALWTFAVGDAVMILLSVFTGLLMYAKYYDCDPVRNKVVPRYDQMIIYFVTSAADKAPGLVGVFIAGIFSAALSTISSNLNSLSATIFEDFVSPCLSHRPQDATVNKIMKGIVLILGVLSLCATFVVEYLGDLLELTYSAVSVTAGTMIGLFTLGFFFPWANTKGALAGSIVSTTIVAWMVFGAKAQIAAGRVIHRPLPTSIDGCPSNYEIAHNVTFNATTVAEDIFTSYRPELDEIAERPFFLYLISYWYYTLVGMMIVILVGMIVSAITGLNNPYDVNPDLLAPQIARRYRRKPLSETENTESCPM